MQVVCKLTKLPNSFLVNIIYFSNVRNSEIILESLRIKDQYLTLQCQAIERYRICVRHIVIVGKSIRKDQYNAFNVLFFSN